MDLDMADRDRGGQDTSQWPSAVQEFLPSNASSSDDDCGGCGGSGGGGKALAMAALGACTKYLNRSLIDHELVSMRNFQRYQEQQQSQQQQPQQRPDTTAAAASSAVAEATAVAADAGSGSLAAEGASSSIFAEKECMHVDGITLSNLELLQNSYDGKRKGSLIDFMDKVRGGCAVRE
jgi:DNA mismatch repair protein MSH6